MGLMDRVRGRLKKATGDLMGEKDLRRQGEREERKADAKEDLKHAQDQVEEHAVRVREAELDAEASRRRRS